MKSSLIISFNPDIELLQKNVNFLSEEMDTIVIVDNNSVNKNKLVEIENSHHKVNVIFLDKNFGIAKATNVGFDYLSSVSEWILVLDQDSILQTKDISTLYSFIDRNEFENLGMITPRYVERNEVQNQLDTKTDSEWQFIDYPIASGSLVKVEAWECVGGYDENLFIDRVDDDFDLRIRNAGYSIIQANNATIDHMIGQIINIRFFNKSIKVYNHTAFRKYYQSRNNIIFAKKHGGVVRAWIRNAILLFKTMLFEKGKMPKFKSIIRGIRDGVKYKL